MTSTALSVGSSSPSIVHSRVPSTASGNVAAPAPTMRRRKSSGRASAAKSTDGAPTSSPTAWTDASPNASSAFAMNSPIACGAKRSSRDPL